MKRLLESERSFIRKNYIRLNEIIEKSNRQRNRRGGEGHERQVFEKSTRNPQRW